MATLHAAMIPASETCEATDALTPPEALGVVRDAADHPALKRFVLATGALVALGWTVSVYIQPASADLLRGQVTPLHGVLYAGFTAVSTVVTYKSGAIREQVGAERWIHRTRAGRPRRGVRTVVPVPLLAVPACFTRRAGLGSTSFFRTRT
ncbi:hypothetical protein SY89_03195 [Halolamina pelagica]|uniref:Uncharacterized protein n=1 Tax=Halolamina pelagica TaxID=699431 RepID=A0A0P7GU08_9EURY|nr:hypothetical protein [Halolamina pelagica]KPN28961.1 hypothetical protein SY89_03195 [Halolamina pelagica]